MEIDFLSLPLLSLFELDFLFQEQTAQYCQNLSPIYPMFKFSICTLQFLSESEKMKNIWKV